MTQPQAQHEAVLVSALSHFSYCPQRCALIHMDHIFDENLFTLRGSMAHERADEPSEETSGGIVEERGLPIWSERYGLYGKADVVEFHPDGSIFPVEYKHGPMLRQAQHARAMHDELQLCAQALCLEEMFGRDVLRGTIYSSSSHARREVELTPLLREKTLEAVDAIREMCGSNGLPPPVNDARCPNCSLVVACMPGGVDSLSQLSADGFLFSPVDAEVIE